MRQITKKLLEENGYRYFTHRGKKVWIKDNKKAEEEIKIFLSKIEKEYNRKYRLKFKTTPTLNKIYKERMRLARKKYYNTNYKRILEKTRQYNRKLKIEVFSHYSDDPLRCYCCEETILEFLTLDHINGGGNKHRRELELKFNINTKGNSFYKWIKDNNYPEGYRIACYNCNHATAYGKTCPHKK